MWNRSKPSKRTTKATISDQDWKLGGRRSLTLSASNGNMNRRALSCRTRTGIYLTFLYGGLIEISVLASIKTVATGSRIKGTLPTESEIHKLSLISQHTKHHGFIFTGLPGEKGIIECFLQGHVRDNTGDDPHWPPDRQITFSSLVGMCSTVLEKCFTGDISTYISAARSARFEFNGK